ncbi:MAG: 3'-5' exonuclease [Lentisphaerota bacterium]
MKNKTKTFGHIKTLNVVILITASLLWGATAADSTNTSIPTRLPPKTTLVDNVTFVVFDTETTGFSPKNDRIVEIGAVKFRDGKVVDKKEWLINPRRSIPYYVQQVHGITPEMVKDSPMFKDVYPEFADFIKGSVLIAHNAPFDVSFMREEIQRSGYEPPKNLTIDSLKLFRKWYPNLKTHTLSEVAKATHVDGDVHHRAEADSLYVFLIMDQWLKQQNNPKTKLQDLYSDAGGALAFR